MVSTIWGGAYQRDIVALKKIFEDQGYLVWLANGQLKNICSTDSNKLCTAVRTTLINLYQNLSLPFIHRHCLMDNWPKKNHFLFMPCV